jgi:hypothetical protein
MRMRLFALVLFAMFIAGDQVLSTRAADPPKTATGKGRLETLVLGSGK